MTSGACTPATTAAFQVVVNQPSVAGTISGTNGLCKPNTGTALTLDGSTGSIVWQKSVNWTAASPTWTAITGATAMIALRIMRKDIHFSLSPFWFCLGLAFFSPIFSIN